MVPTPPQTQSPPESILSTHPTQELDQPPKPLQEQTHPHNLYTHTPPDSHPSPKSITPLNSIDQGWEVHLEKEESVYSSDMDFDGIAELKAFHAWIDSWIEDVDFAGRDRFEIRLESGKEGKRRRIEAGLVAKELRFEEWRLDGEGVVGGGGGDCGLEVGSWRLEVLGREKLFVLGGESDDEDEDESDEEEEVLSFLEQLKRFENSLRQVRQKQKEEIDEEEEEEEEYFDAVEEVVDDLKSLFDDEEYDSDCKVWVQEVAAWGEEKWIEDYKNLKEEDFEVEVRVGWDGVEEEEDEEEDYGEDTFLETGEVLGVVAVGVVVLWAL